MIQTTYNYLDGEWTTCRTKEVFASTNPANTDQILGYCQKSGIEDVRDAIEAAKRAFPSWAGSSPITRGEYLFKVIGLVEKYQDELAELIMLEVGKTETLAKNEVKATIQALQHFAGAANRVAGETVPAIDPNTFTCTLKEPLGVVGVVSPFNFPLGIGIYKIAPALLAGNTVIFKPASDTSLIGVKTVELFHEAGLPKGVLNLITGPGSIVGKEFGENPDIKAVSFTGSSDVGISLGKAVSSRGGKMQAEMGGKNATIILEDADLNEAVQGVITSGFINNGQSCTGTSRVIVPRSIARNVINLLVEKGASLKIGNGREPGVFNGALANEAQLKTYLHYVDIAIKEGAVLELGGKRLTEGDLAKGYFVEPTVFSGVSPTMTIAQEEIFCPVVAVIEVDSFEEAIKVANGTDFGLSATIYTKNLKKAFDFIRQIEVGVAHVNIPSNHYENQLPFGGKKTSSIGPREQGSTALDFWLETKTVYLKP